MKLTKAQRLFIKVGEEQGLMKRYNYLSEIVAYHSKRRKKLIREALEAWQEEKKNAYDEGMGLAMKAFRKWMGDAAQCINKTTKTQHT